MNNIINQISKLREDKNAVILAHYYQIPEIQDIADFVGDSLDLSRKAQDTNADVIVFCGVKFMAETAKILNPSKTVLLPDMEAGCSLEEACQPKEFAEFREKYPNHIAITYINCSAAIKALSDIIVTSTNASKIVEQIPSEQGIIFAPDKYLGAYLNKKLNRNMVLWDGTCIVHEQFSERELIKTQAQNIKAEIIAHPECPEFLLNHAVHIGSTSSLINYVKNKNGGEFIVLTEPGILHAMKKASPNSVFHEIISDNSNDTDSVGSCVSCNRCPHMKRNNLDNLYDALHNMSPEIVLDGDILLKSQSSLKKMLEMS